MSERKRKRTSSIIADDEDGASSLPSPTTSTAARRVALFHQLCQNCRQVIQRASKTEAISVAPFQSTEDLSRSAKDGCHLCQKLQHLIAPENNRLKCLANTKLLSIEIRRLKDIGISLILRHRNEKGTWRAEHSTALGDMNFKFKNAKVIRSMRFFESTDTRSPESWSQIIKWLDSCNTNHVKCRQERRRRCVLDLSDPRNLPKRLIAVGSPGNEEVQVCETEKIAKHHTPTITYLTLSHRWGVQKPAQLLRQNYSSLMQGIELHTLPKTFRDAVEVTRELGVSYLWIDSLCIIQDSVDDWATESAKMHHVYRNSFLNLCAAGATDSVGGLFHQRSPFSSVPCVIEMGPDREECLVSSYDVDIGKEHSEILTRGWVFQELALAPRILFFGKQELYWQCDVLQASETFPDGKVNLGDTEGDSPPESSLHQKLTDLRDQENDIILNTWASIVGDYSKTELTKFSDKLDALAGLAGDFGHAWRTPTEYLAGLWAYRLRQNLLWQCQNPRVPQRLLPVATPSWSWASIDGDCWCGTSKYYSDSEGLAEVLDAQVHRLNASSPYGQVTAGYIRIDGPLVEVVVSAAVPGSWYATFTDSRLDVDVNDLPIEGIFTSKRVEKLPEKIPLKVMWDDKAMKDMVRGAVVHLAPLAVVLSIEGLELEGLLLTPTYLKPSEYRRLGYFRVTDRWVDLDVNAAYKAAFQASGVADCASADDGDAERLDPFGRHIPLVELEGIFQSLDQQLKETKEDCRFGIMRERIHNVSGGSVSAGGVNPSSQNDPYQNGVIDRTLSSRYKNEMDDDDYQHINTILSWAEHYGVLLNYAPTDMGLHGNRFFTYKIV